MDLLDKALFQELSNNCRVSFTELGKKYNVSVNTIKNRVEDMLKEGLIVSFDVQPKLSLYNASFALIILRLKQVLSEEDMDEIGSNQFVTSVSMGMQLDGLVVGIYRNNEELNQLVEYLRGKDGVEKLEVFQMLAPPSSIGSLPSSKGLDSLKKIDWKILHQLRWNGRMHIKDIAEKIGRSAPTVRKRLDYMREKGFLHETILTNIGIVDQGFVINFVLELPEINGERQLEIEKEMRFIFEDSFVVSWMVVDKPILFMTFQVGSAIEAQKIQAHILSMFPEHLSINQAISGSWKYYKDFRDQILEEQSK
ncbi:MAG: Lrp/AsnC family transcriptional regulator [Candidatus Thorarchaeota archaeon]|jgi:DNA-binding Lrp family transcriptional regulator